MSALQDLERAALQIQTLPGQTPDGTDRRTKIVATLGPASWSGARFEAVIASGVDVIRLNSSHRQPGAFEEIIPRIRATSAAIGRNLEIMGDLQGPKFRVGFTSRGGARLETGTWVEFGLLQDRRDICTSRRVTMADTREQRMMVENLQPGMDVLLDDGYLHLRVQQRVGPTELLCEVVNGGELKSHKGVNVPGLELALPSLTDKDYDDMEFFLSTGVDWLAVSFVQREQDLIDVEDYMIAIEATMGGTMPPRPRIIPKIEKPQALLCLDGILQHCQGIMVARGDLGVEIGLHKVPAVQKMLIKKANTSGHWVVTATQMMESMIKNPLPTRAEVWCERSGL